MKKFSNIIFILLVLLLLGVFLYSGWQLMTYFQESSQTQVSYDALSELIQHARPTQETLPESTVDWSKYFDDPNALTEMPESPYVVVKDSVTGKFVAMLPEFEELYAINRDTVGWIRIEGTKVDYPVVQRKEHEDYYLYRDFYGADRKRGCLYVEEACDVFTPSDNVVIYGHMMYDKTMFGDLERYTSKEFWEDHRYIQFDTLRDRSTYEIICVFKTSAVPGKGIAYHHFVNALDADAFDAFWHACQKNAYYDTGLEAGFGDKLLCLSTCEYTLKNGRLVVVARRID